MKLRTATSTTRVFAPNHLTASNISNTQISISQIDAPCASSTSKPYTSAIVLVPPISLAAHVMHIETPSHLHTAREPVEMFQIGLASMRYQSYGTSLTARVIGGSRSTGNRQI